MQRKFFAETIKVVRLSTDSFAVRFDVFAAEKAEWTIGDYLKNLPERYKTYSGDYPKPPPKEAIVLDEENGYASIMRTPSDGVQTFDGEHAIFEMAIFRRAKGDPLLVVSNEISDSVCVRYETFFLQRRGNSWLDARSQVTPQLSAEMFFKGAKLAAKFQATNKKIDNSQNLELRFEPARRGTRMPVALNICDYVPDKFEGKITFDKFIENARSVFLDCDKQEGVFKLTK